jgi:ethanolamine utilization protein EutN
VQLARVIGTVVATQKYKGLEGIKLLVVQPLAPDGRPLGGPEVACDTVQAGPGDHVYTVGSREAALALEETFVPVDLTIVGIVDDVDVQDPINAAGDAAGDAAKAPAKSGAAR